MKRRTDKRIMPWQLFGEALFSPLHWPWKMVQLERNSLHDYRQRSLSANVAVAELYHENSKLCPQTLPELIGCSFDADDFRREFVRRRGAVTRVNGASGMNLDRSWRELLTILANATAPQLFYAIELRVVDGRLLSIFEPVSDTLHIVKELSAADLALLRQGLRLTAPPEVTPHNGPLLFILGSFGRNEILVGPRGYRRTLVEAGQVSQAILNEAWRRRLAIWPIYEYTDRDVDLVMEADGVEESTLMAFELGGTINVP